MKFKAYVTGEVYELDTRRFFQRRGFCPACSADRTKKHQMPLRISPDLSKAYCFHCGETFYPLPEERLDPIPVQQHVAKLPETTPQEAHDFLEIRYPKAKRTLSAAARTWLEARGLDVETALEMGVFSIKDRKGNEVIGFVFSRKGIEYNVKFRGLKEKTFFFANKGAVSLPFNGDSIGTQASLVITEGEPDTLAYATAGIRYVISVPTGAGVKRLDWMRPFEVGLEQIDTFYIAVDDDPRGRELQDVLVEHLGEDRCRIVTFDGCKDANEQLQKYGPEALVKSIRMSRHRGEESYENPDAESCSLLANGCEMLLDAGDGASDNEDFEKLYETMFEILQNGGMKGDKLDVPEIDELVSWRTGQLAIVTGIPTHGKSEFVDFLVICLNRLYGYKAVMWSPENYPAVYHTVKHVTKITGRKYHKNNLSGDDLRVALKDVSNEIFCIVPEEYKLSSVLAAIEAKVVKHKARIVTLDPFNALEYDGESNLTETERINRVLGQLQLLARRLNVLLILVAHPRKMDVLKLRGEASHYQEPTMYDICGSANFLNRADYGIVVYRSAEGEYTEDKKVTNFVRITVEKVRFRDLGSGGSCLLRYNYKNGRYESIGTPVNDWDNSWWKKLEPEDLPETVTDSPDDAPDTQPFSA